MRAFIVWLSAVLLSVSAVQAQNGPLRIEITQGVIEPLPFAIPTFVAETPAAQEWAQRVSDVVANDLVGTGLFRRLPQEAFISSITSFAAPVNFTDWRTINAQALITGAVSVDGQNNIVVKFRAWDVFAGQELGTGMQFAGTPESWRRVAHKIADRVYADITGESAYFDSRVVFVSETGPKNNRTKKLAVMDYDGANIQYLTNGASIVLAPRFSKNGLRLLYTSYETGFPRIYMLDLATGSRRILQEQPGTMSFAPRFSPDGQQVVYSLERGGNTDIYLLNLASGQSRRLTSTPAIETAPSFSPDGTKIVFESDRSGNQQLYVMNIDGSNQKRISFGNGRYGTPVWSPRGDMIAFTKQNKGRFHIGVMRADGSEERLLTASFLDEGPTWSPNGRVIMFTRETQGSTGQASLYSVDVSGRNLRQVRTGGAASDPSWSPLLK
jgi:TolB protein